MTDSNVRRIYSEVASLAIEDKMALLSKLISEVSAVVSASEGRSIYALKSLGKEVWEGVDAQEYVDTERASWE
jgi:hypothetical protein